MDEQAPEYVGFWLRVVATIVDSILVLVITIPLLITVQSWLGLSPAGAGMAHIPADVLKSPQGLSRLLAQANVVPGPVTILIRWVLPAAAIILFWIFRDATPGKMAVSARVVDANTGASLSTGQSIGRYFAYYVSLIPLFLGFVWVAFDSRKQGWHDKLAGTVVVKSK